MNSLNFQATNQWVSHYRLSKELSEIYYISKTHQRGIKFVFDIFKVYHLFFCLYILFLTIVRKINTFFEVVLLCVYVLINLYFKEVLLSIVESTAMFGLGSFWSLLEENIDNRMGYRNCAIENDNKRSNPEICWIFFKIMLFVLNWETFLEKHLELYGIF
jgi:hypothetical protein